MLSCPPVGSHRYKKEKKKDLCGKLEMLLTQHVCTATQSSANEFRLVLQVRCANCHPVILLWHNHAHAALLCRSTA